MTRVLNSEMREAASGRATTAVIFVHGYGANGADLLGLSDVLAEHLPDTVFYAPDAPEKIPAAPMGFQWFPIPYLDGSSELAAEEGLERAKADLNAFIDRVMIDHDFEPEQVLLFGFSQGTMLSLHVAPRRDEELAGVVGFSGRLLQPDLIEDEATVKPPVILIHGDQDPVVPFNSLPEAANTMVAAGFEVYAHVMKGTEHGIAPDGLSVAVAFMREKLHYGPAQAAPQEDE